MYFATIMESLHNYLSHLQRPRTHSCGQRRHPFTSCVGRSFITPAGHVREAHRCRGRAARKGAHLRGQPDVAHRRPHHSSSRSLGRTHWPGNPPALLVSSLLVRCPGSGGGPSAGRAGSRGRRGRHSHTAPCAPEAGSAPPGVCSHPALPRG